MTLSIEERTKLIAEFLIENKCTVRVASKVFGIAKSTVHKDLTERLPFIDKQLYKNVRRVLDSNFAQKHLRGGESTKQMYLKKKHCR